MKKHTELKIVGLLSLGRDEHNLLSNKRVALLDKVGECGSITLQKMLDGQQKRIEQQQWQINAMSDEVKALQDARGRIELPTRGFSSQCAIGAELYPQRL